MKKILGLMAIALLVCAPAATAATITYDLNIDHCTGTCGTGPFVQVTLTDISATTVQVDAVLLNALDFVETGLGATFAFNLPGFPAISYSNVTAGWNTLSPSAADSVHMDGFGDFDYGLVWGTQGGGHGTPGPLSFQVTSAGGLNIGDFATLSTGGSPSVFFAADILGDNRLTGPVGGGSGGSVPEPASLLLFGSGLLGAGLFGKRLRK